MNHKLRLSSVLAVILVLNACTSVPTGPGMPSLPGKGKNFNQFLLDDADCRQYASAQVGGRTANEAAAGSGVAGEVTGTSIGTTEGALGTGESSGLNLQQRYDLAYYQCMYAKGHRVPVSDRLEYSRQTIKDKDSNYAPSPAPSGAPSLPSEGSFVPPPPPYGPPPPPPPDVYTPPTTPDDKLPLMPSDDFQPPMPPSGNPPSSPPDA